MAPDKSGWYTRAEFVKYYLGTTEWYKALDEAQRKAWDDDCAINPHYLTRTDDAEDSEDEQQPSTASERQARNERDLALARELFPRHCEYHVYFKFVRGRDAGCSYGNASGCRNGSHIRPSDLSTRMGEFEAARLSHSSASKPLSSKELRDLIDFRRYFGDPDYYDTWEWDPDDESEFKILYSPLRSRAEARLSQLDRERSSIDDAISRLMSSAGSESPEVRRLRGHRSDNLGEVWDLRAALDGVDRHEITKSDREYTDEDDY